MDLARQRLNEELRLKKGQEEEERTTENFTENMTDNIATEETTEKKGVRAKPRLMLERVQFFQD